MKLTPWLPISPDSDFSIYNLPFGIFSTPVLSPRPGIALGDQVIHLAALVEKGLLDGSFKSISKELEAPVLNPLIESGPEVWKKLRLEVQRLFSNEKPKAWDGHNPEDYLVPMAQAKLHLPVQIGDYTDFYSSEYHATNVGLMFRPDNPLMPNWKHMPIAYHGRSSSIVVSGTDFHRPKGQLKPPTAEVPIYAPTRQMDMELETGFVIGKSTEQGSSIGVEKADQYIFGMLLFNDWSARDIQSWEYQPLGPFLGKNFCSSVSPWIVTMEALEQFRLPLPAQSPEVLSYLKADELWTLDIHLEAELALPSGASKTIAKTNQKYLYWSLNQQLAHHTVNGCPMRTGDLLASGTISGPTPDSLGCLLESTKRGQNPIAFDNGEQRTFMEDRDRITLKGFAEKDGIRVGFGEVTGKVLPAVN